jgi:hypothetical protein
MMTPLTTIGYSPVTANRPITVEPGLPLGYLDHTDDILFDHLSESSGLYAISLKTLIDRYDLVIENLIKGSTIAVEKTDESVATLWHIVKNHLYHPWFANGSLRWITGGDADASIRNLNNEHFLRATIGSQESGLSFSQSLHRPYKFLFTNKKIRPHRRYLILELQRLGLLENALWSCLGQHNTWGHEDFNRVYADGTSMPVRLLPHGYDPEIKPSWIDGVIYPRHFDETYFSVVAETIFEYPHSFRTEKTYKPILAAHPFVICANAGFYRDLHHMGFRTFGSLIDESFDSIMDGKDRMDRLIHEVRWLCDQDLDRFWLETRDICLYNQQHAQELHTNQQNTFTEKFREFMHAT